MTENNCRKRFILPHNCRLECITAGKWRKQEFEAGRPITSSRAKKRENECMLAFSTHIQSEPKTRGWHFPISGGSSYINEGQQGNCCRHSHRPNRSEKSFIKTLFPGESSLKFTWKFKLKITCRSIHNFELRISSKYSPTKVSKYLWLVMQNSQL